MRKLPDRYRRVEFGHMPLPKRLMSERFGHGTKNDRIRQTSFYTKLSSYIDVFFKQCIILDETTVHNQK